MPTEPNEPAKGALNREQIDGIFLDHSFRLTWVDRIAQYRVSRPNIGTCDVVPMSAVTPLITALEQANREVDELRKDKARLDWLTEHRTVTWKFGNVAQLTSDWIKPPIPFKHVPEVRELLDTGIAIDKAKGQGNE